MAELTRAIGCTVVARRELPFAHVLAGSYLEHHPDHEFVVVVLDHAPGLDAGTGVRVVGPEWLACAEFDRLATAFDAKDLAAAVVPHALRSALAEATVAIYLAPSVQILAPLSEVVPLAESNDIVLTPRLLDPLPLDGLQPDDVTEPFSLGFVAVGQGAREFLDFWARERRHAPTAAEPRRQIHAVQRVPGLFRHTVVRDPGFDAGYWNLHERPADLKFVNFDGYNPRKPWLLSEHCRIRPRVLLSENEQLRALADGYRQAVLAAGEPGKEYGFDRMPDGSALTASVRRFFRQEWAAAERDTLVPTANPTPLPPPASDGEAFTTWLRSPADPKQAAAGLTRIAAWVWDQRPDLQVAFRHPYLEDAEAFRNWCRDFGVAERQLPQWALPRKPEPRKPPVPEFGVNLAGYLTGELGLGEQGRITHRVLEHAGVPVVSVVEERSLSCRTSLPEPDDTGWPKFPVSILAVNADYTRLMLETYPDIGHGRYRIGLWAWELEDFPEWQHDAFGMLDEIWAVSEWCRQAIAAHSPIPVKAIPVAVLDPGEVSRPQSDIVQFLFAFDFNSTAGRKNPMGVLSAFRQAFPDRDDVRLVIKATNAELHAPAAEELRLAVRGDHRVRLLERYLSVAELNELYTNSHAYVSLHRSEGFGLTVAEAMIRGVPVISTDYSGTAEFVDESVGWPIAHGMVEVGPGWQPYQADGLWADPDLDQAARAMREIADNPAEANRRGKAAREHLLHNRSVEAAATWMRTQLTAAYEEWQRRQHPPQETPSRGQQIRSVARRGVNRLRRHTGR